MKALSVKPPWAELIISGKKKIENRNWKTNYRGKLAIHECGENGRGIIGHVELVDILPWHEAEKQYPDQKQYIEGRYCWVMQNPVRLKEPIKAKGQLGLFLTNLI